MRRPLIQYLIIILILSSPLYSDDNLLSDIRIYNSTSEKIHSANIDSLRILTERDIREWAGARGLVLIPDRAPYIDNRALYFTDFRGVIPVESLKRNHRYILQIDFVKFKNLHFNYLSYIKLFIRDSSGSEFELVQLDKGELFDKKMFRITLPRQFTYDGSFELIFYEYSEVPGMWGIWDIIIYPESVDIESIGEIEPEITDEGMQHIFKIFQ